MTTDDGLDEPVLKNAWVRVHRRRVGPRQGVFPPAPTPRSLAVFVRGGVVRHTATGRAVAWPDGSVAWLDRIAQTGARWINDGADAMHVVVVDVLDSAPSASRPPPAPLEYPNVPGEDLLDNDAVIVQRFRIPPGTWEGIHAHGERTLYVHVRGGRWAVRSHSEPEYVYPEPSADGEVDGMTPIALAEGHESGNVGDEPIDIVWITVK
jgi:hypothetical protein